MARSFFSWLLAKEFNGFLGKPKVTCFCVLFYVHIEILAVLVPVI